MTNILTSYVTTKTENYQQLKEEAQANFTTASEALSTVTEDYESLIADAAELDKATALLADSFVADPEEEINPAEVLSEATTRIEDDIPEVLRDRAKARVALISNRIADSLSIKNTSLSHALTQTTSSTGDSGLVAQRWSELENAHEQLGQYALTTVSQYNTAIDLLQSIVSSTDLSDSSSEAIEEAALAEDADAVTTETTLQAARAAVDAKQLELEEAIIDAVIADVNADPADDATVQAKESELSTLEDDLTSAESAHTAEFSTAMDLWEASVPDHIWNNFHNYEKAIALLTSVSTSAAASLVTAVTDAETALVTAMQTEDNNHRLTQFLESAAHLLTKEYDYLLSAEKSLSLSALRGDF